jgi:integrase
MAKIVKQLTDTQIKNSKPKEKDYKIADGQGLYIVIKSNGTKFFRYDFSFQNKRQSMSFGVYGNILLKEARELKEKAKETLKLGLNPIVAKKSNFVVNNTFSSVANAWLEVQKHDWSENTYLKNKRSLEQNIYNHIGYRDITSISRIEIIEVIKIMENRGVIELAKRTLNLIDRIYKYAVTYDIVEHNIISDIDTRQTFKRTKESHYPAIIDDENLARLLLDIDEYQNDFRADISTIYALKLAPLLCLRSGNLRFLEWSEINFEKQQIEISAAKMKMKKDFIQPISNQAFKLIKELEQSKSSKYLFPSSITNNKVISDNTLTQALKRMGYKEKHTIHGFRSSFSTIAHENTMKHGFYSEIIELSLAHEDKNKVRSAYNRESTIKFLDERRELNQWYSDYLDKIKMEYMSKHNLS